MDVDTHPAKTKLVNVLVASYPSVAEQPIIGFSVTDKVVGKKGK